MARTPNKERSFIPFLVENTVSGQKVIVKAVSAASALEHVVKPRFKVSKPTAGDIVDLMGDGVAVEVAGEPVADEDNPS